MEGQDVLALLREVLPSFATRIISPNNQAHVVNNFIININLPPNLFGVPEHGGIPEAEGDNGRQNHGGISPPRQNNIPNDIPETAPEVCNICVDNLVDSVLNCGHQFCNTCLLKIQQCAAEESAADEDEEIVEPVVFCPHCRSPFKEWDLL